MQTLNVGAGRTDAEYKADEEQRRDDLRDESRNMANFFFWAAGLAALATGILPIKLNVLVSIGAFDLFAFYGRSLGSAYELLLYVISAGWVASLVGLGFAARSGYRVAFIVGIFMYVCDTIALMMTFSVFAVGVHGFFVFMWFKGQSALKDLHEVPA